MTQPHATRFARVRKDHSSELAEDYVETIMNLIEEDGDARLTEIASRLGVAHPTVSKALKKLHREGLVIVRPYQSILLTAKGENLATTSRARHDQVLTFLLALGVDRETAETDAEGIEHHVSTKTLKAMNRYVKNLK
jgi:DtxR family manganese transport transcriptional regulator